MARFTCSNMIKLPVEDVFTVVALLTQLTILWVAPRVRRSVSS